MRRVVITGLGPITPIGIGKETFWEAIKNKESGIRPVSTFDASVFKATSAADISKLDQALATINNLVYLQPDPLTLRSER